MQTTRSAKKTCYTEIAYLLGVLFLAFGAACMTHADLGLSMIVAPAYVIHRKVSQFLPFFTFGMAEYALQAVLILVLSLVLRRFKISYLFSFVTAVLYGFCLDFMLWIVNRIPVSGLPMQLVFFAVGFVFCTTGVAFMFHTYISPEAYELVVKEIATAFHKDINRVKIVYDISSCLAAILLSFLFFGFGHFEGIKYGTIVSALLNGWLIGRISVLLESRFVFRDALKLKPLFEK
ncbi:MAG: hypothetical protein II781_03725 [Clostridia bacterium]|nr:hypothetical protein [Clostridia bacterium]